MIKENGNYILMNLVGILFHHPFLENHLKLTFLKGTLCYLLLILFLKSYKKRRRRALRQCLLSRQYLSNILVGDRKNGNFSM